MFYLKEPLCKTSIKRKEQFISLFYSVENLPFEHIKKWRLIELKFLVIARK